jgi:transcription elongation factor GreA-like protein
MIKLLNESRLRNIIDESIKEVLNELDWKSYASASRERAKRDCQNGYKTNQLDYAATCSLNRKFPSKDKRIKHDTRIKTNYNDFNGHNQEAYSMPDEYGDYQNIYVRSIDTPSKHRGYVNSAEYPEKNKELSDYFNGNYYYSHDDGKWKLKQ